MPILASIKETIIAFNSILGAKHRYIFDKAVVAKQLSVVEAFGLLLFRVEKGKHSDIGTDSHTLSWIPRSEIKSLQAGLHGFVAGVYGVTL